MFVDNLYNSGRFYFLLLLHYKLFIKWLHARASAAGGWEGGVATLDFHTWYW